jgi:hypothetical protein
MSQLDALLPDDDHPDSPAWRRLILIELRKALIIRRGVTLRLRTKRGAR